MKLDAALAVLGVALLFALLADVDLDVLLDAPKDLLAVPRSRNSVAGWHGLAWLTLPHPIFAVVTLAVAVPLAALPPVTWKFGALPQVEPTAVVRTVAVLVSVAPEDVAVVAMAE